jgi:Na+/proline symporter
LAVVSTGYLWLIGGQNVNYFDRIQGVVTKIIIFVLPIMGIIGKGVLTFLSSSPPDSEFKKTYKNLRFNNLKPQG